MSRTALKSAERTLDVLELLGSAGRPLPAMAIARRCEIPKASMYNLLNVLRTRGFVDYDSRHGSGSCEPACAR
jgi:DNA-binding IclR family transcriptional regulator